MLRLASDADVFGQLVRGLRRRSREIDLLRAVDALPEGAPDSDVLAWAAEEGRILIITNDRNSMVGSAFWRATQGSPMPGVIATTNKQSIGSTIEDIELIAECMSEQEIMDQVVIFLPLRG